MTRWLLCTLLGILLVGCAAGTYRIERDDYRARVKTLGVLPILVDESSQIDHSQRDELLALLRSTALGKIEPAVELLRGGKGYFDVRYVAIDPRATAGSLLLEKRPDIAPKHLPGGYRFAVDVTQRLTKTNVVDALLVVVLAGVEHDEKRRSRTGLETLQTRYNDIYATAAVIDTEGAILWEMVGSEAYPLLTLQYPDFDEAHFNHTDAVRIKEIGLAGLEKELTKGQVEGDAARLPLVYQGLLNRVVRSLGARLF